MSTVPFSVSMQTASEERWCTPAQNTRRPSKISSSSASSRSVPALVLQIVVHLRRNTQASGNVQMIVRRLKILDPALARDADLGIAEQVDIGGSVSLQRRDDHGIDIVQGEALRAQNVLRQLLFGADDLGLWITEEVSQAALISVRSCGGPVLMRMLWPPPRTR